MQLIVQFPLRRWADDNKRRWKWVLANYGKGDAIPKHIGRPSAPISISEWARLNGISRQITVRLFKEGRLPQTVDRGTERSLVMQTMANRKVSQRRESLQVLEKGVKREIEYAKVALEEVLRQLMSFQRQVKSHRKYVYGLNHRLILLKRHSVASQKYYMRRALKLTSIGAVEEITKLRGVLKEKWKNYEENEDAKGQDAKDEGAPAASRT